MPAPTMPVPPFAPASKDTIQDVAPAVAVMGLLVQTAACVGMGVLAWFLYQDALIY
jgi:hypothetical protein